MVLTQWYRAYTLFARTTVVDTAASGGKGFVHQEDRRQAQRGRPGHQRARAGRHGQASREVWRQVLPRQTPYGVGDAGRWPG
eukprot:8376991-Prorocentrum_lima.AAC.1